MCRVLGPNMVALFGEVVKLLGEESRCRKWVTIWAVFKMKD